MELLGGGRPVSIIGWQVYGGSRGVCPVFSGARTPAGCPGVMLRNEHRVATTQSPACSRRTHPPRPAARCTCRNGFTRLVRCHASISRAPPDSLPRVRPCRRAVMTMTTPASPGADRRVATRDERDEDPRERRGDATATPEDGGDEKTPAPEETDGPTPDPTGAGRDPDRAAARNRGHAGVSPGE